MMRWWSLVGSVVLLTSGAAAVESSDLAPASELLGYPVFIGIEKGRCTFQIQDMIMSRQTDAERWLLRFPDKTRQVDVVVATETAAASLDCARSLRRAALEAGFEVVLIRVRAGLAYPPGGPPR
jgi:hypothetical protein